MPQPLRVPHLLAVVVLAGETIACSDSEQTAQQPCTTRIESDGAIVRSGACDAGAPTDAEEDLGGVV
jgi:hypothetical protein